MLKAIELDPDYAPAWAGLAYAHTRQSGLGYVAVDDGYRKARQEVKKALALDDTLGEAHAILAWIEMAYDWDWIGADASLKRALKLEPGNPTAVRIAATLAYSQGRIEEALLLNRRAVELDPLNPTAYYFLGKYALNAGRFDEATAASEKVLELNPEYRGAHMLLGLIYLAQSRTREAMQEIKEEKEPWRQLWGYALVYHAAGKKKEADVALAELIEKYPIGFALQIAGVYAFRGEKDQAFEWLERAYTQRDAGLAEVNGDRLLKNLHSDSRYAAFLKNMRLPL